MALAVAAGRAEGQGLPVRTSISARAVVLPLPAAQSVAADSAGAGARLPARVPPSDTAAADRPRVRRIVVTYPGT